MKYKLYFNKAQDEQMTRVQKAVDVLQDLGYKKVDNGNIIVTFKNSSGKHINIFTHNREKEIVSLRVFGSENYFTEEEIKLLMDAIYDRTGDTDSMVSFLWEKGYRLTRLSPIKQLTFHKIFDDSSLIDLYVDEVRKLISANRSNDARRVRIPLEPAVGKFFDFLGYEYDNYSNAKDPISIEDWFE